MSNFRLSAIAILITTPVLASDYVVFLDKKSNDYQVGGFTDNKLEGIWAETSRDCSFNKEITEIYYGEDFTQTETCNINEKRTITVERTYDNGTTEIVQTYEETRINPTPVITTANAIGTHLEQSCNDIIINNYATTDGVYQVGTESDNFQVYCDMRENEGWTLIAKSPGGDSSGNYITKDWFVNGYNSADILNLNYSYNGEKSSLGYDNIIKLNHTNLVEIQFIAELDNSQNAKFYKSVTNTNMNSWFRTNETTTTTVCTNSDMTQNCTDSKFWYEENTRYWLDGASLSKYGFEISAPETPDIHYHFNSSNYDLISPTMCSVTANRNDNAWNDSARDGHWGNGMIIYIK